MPTTIEDLTTGQLLEIADGTNSTTDWTVAEAVGELRYRYHAENDTSVPTSLRGGVRPTHQPPNP